MKANQVMLKARISVPALARAGELITLKTLVSHPMETGYRRNAVGASIDRNILTSFECHFNDTLVMRAELQPGIAANPFFRFHLRATESGTLTFRWRDQHGVETVEHRPLTVKP